MGASGAGKTAVGTALAGTLGWPFYDADDFHAPEAIAQMSRAEPLTDAQRQPWLRQLRSVIAETLRDGGSAVIACSALRQEYRDLLAGGNEDAVRFVFLAATRELLRERVTRREGHFAGAGLIDSQLAVLEPPSTALAVDAAAPIPDLVAAIIAYLRPPK